jgi:PAP2 superfamily protein
LGDLLEEKIFERRWGLMKEQLRWTVLLLTTVCRTIVPIAAAQNPKGSCWHETKLDFMAGVKGIPGGIESIPGGVVHGDYKWLLPVGLATGLLIGTHADQRASRHITSRSSEQTSGNLSNALMGVELGSAGLTYLVGCRAGGHSHARSAGFHALEAAGYALATDGIMKAAFRREYPYTPGGDGRFWHGGGSFPSGHTATSFGFASAMAHEYPHNRWVAIASYSAAVVESGLRFSAKKHFPSDLLIGATIGYPIGRHFGKE